jgi:putative MATE family efflux protein
MKKEKTSDEKYHQMVETPVEKLVCRLAVPTIISMLITSIYNMADTFFVGKLGTSATGAVGIAFSLMALIQAIGFTMGMGSGNYIARLLGEQDRERAEKVAATGFFTSMFLGAGLMISGLIFLEPLVKVLGATDTILPYAKEYTRYILIGAPYMTAALSMNNILRLQGSAFYGMIGIGAGGILNIALDPIFIFGLHMGTGGAALATILSQLVSFVLLFYFSNHNGNIPIRWKNFSPGKVLYGTILKSGLPSFYRQGLASLSTMCLNHASAPYGDAAIAAMSIVTRVFVFANSALIGFGQGFQPVCGFNYGAKKYDRVRRAFWFCVRTSTIVLVGIAVVIFCFAPQVISIFRKEDLEVIKIGSLALRFQCITFPLQGWIVMNNMMQQTVGKGLQASILALARQGIFLIPAILILSNLFGILGIQFSQTVADIATFMLAVPMGIHLLKELRFKEKDLSDNIKSD